MEALLRFTELILPIVTTGAVAFAVWVLQEMRKARQSASQKGDATLEAVKMAMVTILRHQMIQTHRQAAKGWEITTTERNNFVEMHEAYVALGGTGITIGLLGDIQKMKVHVP